MVGHFHDGIDHSIAAAMGIHKEIFTCFCFLILGEV